MIESWLWNRLKSYPPLLSFATTAGVSIPVYPLYAPQTQAEPFVVFSKASTSRDYTTRTNDGFPTSTFDIQCWETDYTRLIQWSALVRQSIDGYTESVTVEIQSSFVTDEYDFPEPPDWAEEKPIYSRRLVLEVCHSETVINHFEA